MPKASAHLFCWHEFKVNKVFTIGALRMEFLSRHPDIVQVHDAFSNTELGEASGSKAFPHVNSQTEHVIQQKVKQMTGFVTEGARAADPTLVVSHFPGGRTELSVDLVCKFMASTMVLTGRKPVCKCTFATIAARRL